MYLLTIEAHHESISFLFVLLITTSLSAGVLHVPACNHDRPPKAGTYFLCTCAVYRITFLTGCAYRHPRSRPVVGADDLLYQHNEGKQISENQYFHVDTSLFLTYYIQKTGCESGIYILITGVYCSITFGFLCFIIRRYVHSIA